jgi:hypothetical protein
MVKLSRHFHITLDRPGIQKPPYSFWTEACDDSASIGDLDVPRAILPDIDLSIGDAGVLLAEGDLEHEPVKGDGVILFDHPGLLEA